MTKLHAGSLILLAASLGWSQPSPHDRQKAHAGNQVAVKSEIPRTSDPSLTASVQPPAAAANPAPSPQESARKRLRKPAPLQHLNFSARQGFSLRLISNEQVTAELKNGAGRTLARGNYTLEAGEWKLHPRNLPPGLYTVLLRTGAQLRSMRMKIEDAERGQGSPEWVLEKSADNGAETVVPAPGATPGPTAAPGASPAGSRLTVSFSACPV